jgi:SAM-dependent methyltransferase
VEERGQHKGDWEMTANYDFMLKKCEAICPGGRILDYGCGRGEVVISGRSMGLDLFGVDAFFGSNAKNVINDSGLLGTVVFELTESGIIPFKDGYFDLVISNQVFEHVENIDLVLGEIGRVLNSDGKLLALFPSLEVVREGHCGVPIVHWFSKDSSLRYPYMLLMRTLEFGYFKTGKTKRIWAHDFLEWLDRFTFYRSKSEIESSFQNADFSIMYIEEDYITFRLSRLRLSGFAFLTSLPLLRQPVRFACRLLGGMVIMSSRMR